MWKLATVFLVVQLCGAAVYVALAESDVAAAGAGGGEAAEAGGGEAGAARGGVKELSYFHAVYYVWVRAAYVARLHATHSVVCNGWPLRV